MRDYLCRWRIRNYTKKAISEPEVIKASTYCYLGASLVSIMISFILWVTGKKEKSLFVGQWPAAFLLLGLYDRMFKMKRLLKRL